MKLARGWISEETWRWSLSFIVVLGLHGSATVFALNWRGAQVPAGAPPAALMIDMAPAAPAPTVASSPPVPEQRAEIPPPVSEPDVPPEMLPEPEVALPALPPKPEPEVALPASPPKPVREVAAEPEDAAPQRTPDAEPAQSMEEARATHPAHAARAAAPESGASTLMAGAVATWQALLLAHLEKHKRYPREAQWLKQEGVVELYFAMDRAGRVLASRIETSSHSAALDNEALALLVRAEPLPLPPDDLPDARFELVVPVHFALQR